MQPIVFFGELVTFIFGLVALFGGEYSLFRDRIVEGDKARIVGAVLILPITLKFCMGCYASTLLPDLITELSLLEFLGWIISIGVAVLVAGASLSTPSAAPAQRYAPFSPGTQPARDMLTVEEAAVYLNLLQSEVLGLIESGRLRALQLTDGYRIGKWELDDFSSARFNRLGPPSRETISQEYMSSSSRSDLPSMPILTDPDCFICRKQRGEIEMPGGVIYEDEFVYIGHIPISPDQTTAYLGYLMAEPKRHAPKLFDLTDEEAAVLGVMVARLSRALQATERAEHVYAFVLGDQVAHVHIHVVPRYPNAPREYWGVHVDEWPDAPHGGPEEIEALCDRIRDYLESEMG